MLWSSPIDQVVTFSMLQRNAPTSFQSLKMPGIHTNIECWLVGRRLVTALFMLHVLGGSGIALSTILSFCRMFKGWN